MIVAYTESHSVRLTTSIIEGGRLYSRAECDCGKQDNALGSETECVAWGQAHVREVEQAREEAARLRAERRGS